jgi:hypothetical protein
MLTSMSRERIKRAVGALRVKTSCDVPERFYRVVRRFDASEGHS